MVTDDDLLTQPAAVDAPATTGEAAETRGESAHVLMVPAERCSELALPRLPRSKRDLRAMIRDAAPLAIEELVWTAAARDEAGAISATLARRASLDLLAERQSSPGASVELRAATTGRCFYYRTPARRRAIRITLALWLVALALLGAALVRVALAETPAAAVAQQPAPVIATDPVYTRPPVARTAAALAQTTLPDARLIELSRRADGTLLAEYATADADRLQAAIASEALLPGYETRRVRDAADGFRVAYRLVLPATGEPPRSAAPLAAGSAGDAAGRAEAAIRALAGDVPLVLNRASSDDGDDIAFSVTLTASQAEVLAAANRIESARPPMRFAQWSLRAEGAGVKLSGRLVAAWSAR